ncbi:MAG: glycosyltransferase family 4 protein [Deltaproteobacteria bacterium]|nr:glycosyltransferase family 4 protein [Deltaproteobacteria bacterium]
MRITFLETTLEEGKGIPNRAVALAGGLASLGHDVTLLSFRTDRADLPAGVRVRRVPALGAVPLPFRLANASAPPLHAAAGFFIQRALASLAPDIVCVDYPPLDRHALEARGGRAYKVAYTYHGVANPAHYEGAAREARVRTRATIYRNVREADLVLSVSRFCAGELEAEGVSSVLLPNGVDTKVFAPGRRIAALHGGGPLLLYIGRYTEHKGVLDLLRAFAIAREKIPGATLLCFARHESPAYVARLRSFIDEAGLAQSAHLFRDVYGEIVPALYATADVFVSGALDETFGMTFVEAAACGTPSVAYDSQSIPEVVLDGRTGLLAPPGDVEGLAARMVELAGDESRRRTMGEAALKHALNFSWDLLATRFEACLETLVTPARRAKEPAP